MRTRGQRNEGRVLLCLGLYEFSKGFSTNQFLLNQFLSQSAVPEVNRGRGDARNIIGVILTITDDELYQIGTKNGILKQLYARSQINVYPRVLLDADDVPSTKIALRSPANLQSTGTGQGFKKCLCKKNCATARFVGVDYPRKVPN
ncbi:hypothetical protein ACJJTC_016054 [Scirpophaga incertulas]